VRACGNADKKPLKSRPLREFSRSGISLFPVACGGIPAEQQRNTPYGRKAHEGIDHSAHGGRLTAADICHKIKAEQAHKAPVQAADYGKYQRNAIHDHHASRLLYKSLLCYPARFLKKIFIRQK
jgi:hypothetical protein